jgi:hypothetical protein
MVGIAKAPRKLLPVSGEPSFPVLVLARSHNALESNVWLLQQVLKSEGTEQQRQREHAKLMM